MIFVTLKTNFNTKKTNSDNTQTNIEKEVQQKDLTEEEFEALVSRSGASGSFMIFRSSKKEDELGLDEL